MTSTNIALATLPRTPFEGYASEEEINHWAVVAQQVADTLALDVLDRDRANNQPRAEVQLLRSSGLLNLLVPKQYGGAGGHFETAFQAVRILASVDGSISQLLAYHYFNQTGIAFYAAPEQQENWWRLTAEGGWLWGDSVNPVDPSLKLTYHGNGYVLSGHKRFCTGSGVGDVIIINAVVDGGPKHGQDLAFVIEADRQGVELLDDWDHLGQRLTASGSVKYHDVQITDDDVLGVVTDEPISTLLTPGVQLGFANFYLGVAEGALAHGRQILLERKNAWLFSDAETYSRDAIFQRTIGELKARTAAVAALAEKLNRRYDREVGRSADLTAEQRWDFAAAIAELKVVSTEVGIEVANRIYEVTGASSTKSDVGLDLYWRNIRTHTLHDPVDYKKIEVGQYYLHGDTPPLSLYT